jgi:hypothetical protein
MTEEVLRDDARDEEGGDDEANDVGRATTVLKEQGEERQTERGSHPLDENDDRQSIERLLRR